LVIDRVTAVPRFRMSAEPKELPPSRLPAMPSEPTAERPPSLPRPSGPGSRPSRSSRAVGHHQPTLIGLKGPEKQQVGRDVYLTLSASGFTPDQLGKIGVKVAVTCFGGGIVPVWLGGRPLSKLLSQIPSGETLALPFIVAWADAKKALDDGRKPLEIAEAIRVRVEFGDQRVEHRTRLTIS
jgi:hypothetical protein